MLGRTSFPEQNALQRLQQCRRPEEGRGPGVVWGLLLRAGLRTASRSQNPARGAGERTVRGEVLC